MSLLTACWTRLQKKARLLKKILARAKERPMKLMSRSLISVVVVVIVFVGGVLVGQQSKARVVGQPKTIIHFVSLKFLPRVSDAEKANAIAGIKTMAAQIPGIKNVW